MAARLSSAGVSHHSLLPYLPLIHLCTVNSSPRPGIAPHSPNSSSQPLRLPGDPRPCPGYAWLWQGLMILIGCHGSAVSLSAINVSPVTQTVASTWGSDPTDQFPHWLRAGPVLLTLLPPPSSFILPSFAWFCILFSTAQVLLSALSCCSACTSVSEGVFLMYPWTEMYSTSTYSSTILFFQQYIF